MIACLPNESKEILDRNEIKISTKPPLFNYTTFIKNISIHEISETISKVLKGHQLRVKCKIVSNQETIKMIMSQVS